MVIRCRIRWRRPMWWVGRGRRRGWIRCRWVMWGRKVPGGRWVIRWGWPGWGGCLAGRCGGVVGADRVGEVEYRACRERGGYRRGDEGVAADAVRAVGAVVARRGVE